MTVLQRYGGWLLLLLGIALAAYGLVDERDVVVLAGALLAAFGVLADRLGGVSRRDSDRSVSAQVRREMEARVAEKLRQARDN